MLRPASTNPDCILARGELAMGAPHPPSDGSQLHRWWYAVNHSSKTPSLLGPTLLWVLKAHKQALFFIRPSEIQPRVQGRYHTLIFLMPKEPRPNPGILPEGHLPDPELRCPKGTEGSVHSWQHSPTEPKREPPPAGSGISELCS